MTLSIAAANIAGQAFRFLELAPLSSFDDGSEKATAAGAQYPIARNMCLEAYDWSFARRTVVLARASLPATFYVDPELPYVFALPGDLLTLRKVIPSTTKWRREGRYLLSDQSADQVLRYTFELDNEGQMPATFQTMVALQLAVLLASAYLATRTKRDALLNDLDAALSRAKRNDQESASPARYDDLPDQGDWVTGALL